MKRVKKIISMVVTLILIASFLTACVVQTTSSVQRGETETQSQEEEKPEPVDLNWNGKVRAIANWQVFATETTKPYDELTESSRIQYDFLRSLEEKYNCTFETVMTESGEIIPKIISSAMAGDVAAEILVINTDDVRRLVKEGILEPLEDYFVDLESRFWDTGFIKDSTINGRIYGVKARTIGELADLSLMENRLWFNKKIVKEAGVTDKELYELALAEKWTWDKFMEVARKCVKDIDGDGKTDVYGFLMRNWPTIPSMNHALHVKEVDGKFVSGLLDPEFIEAVQLFVDAYKEGVMHPLLNYSNGPIDRFAAGEAAFLFGYHYNNTKILGTMSKEDLGFLPMPIMPSADGYFGFSLQTVQGYSMQQQVPDDKKQILAYIFEDLCIGRIRELPEEERQKQYAAQRESTIINLSALEELRIMELMQKKYPTTIDNAVYIKNLYQLYQNSLWDAIKGNKTVREALEEYNPIIQARIDEVFNN